MRCEGTRFEKRKQFKKYDLVLANPPFGSDISFKYNRKCDSAIEMNFLMMMMDLLNDEGRAGIIIPKVFYSTVVRNRLVGSYSTNSI